MCANTPDVAQRHVPVLRDRIVALLGPAFDSDDRLIHVDATLGHGGHALAVLEAYPQVHVVGIDRDESALALSAQRLSAYAERVTFVQAVYDEIPEVLAARGIEQVQGLLFDLGVSSMQLDEVDRGFAYRVDAPLDMRMDQQGDLTAADILNTWPQEQIEQILRDYGEERFARKIARAIVTDRQAEPFARSQRLVDLLTRVIPSASQRSGGHPAKRTFQALRIAVNDELSVWQRAARSGVDALAVGGRMAVLSYHSLEDRITKRVFAEGATSRTPAELPVELPEEAAYLRLITRGAEQPTDAENTLNPRAASARLRIAERTRSTTSRGTAR